MFAWFWSLEKDESKKRRKLIDPDLYLKTRV